MGWAETITTRLPNNWAWVELWSALFGLCSDPNIYINVLTMLIFWVYHYYIYFMSNLSTSTLSSISTCKTERKDGKDICREKERYQKREEICLGDPTWQKKPLKVVSFVACKKILNIENVKKKKNVIIFFTLFIYFLKNLILILLYIFYI